MLYPKLLGCAAVALSGLAFGVMKSRSLYARRDSLKRVLVFLSSLATNIRYSSDEISSAVSAAANSSDAAYLCVEADRDTPFYDRWEEAVKSIPKVRALNNSDKELLLGFGEKLGKTDLEGQLSHIELYRALFQKQIKEAEDDAQKKSRLYRTLGIFGGVSAAILIF